MNLKLLRMTLRVAARSLQRNKLRSALTMLGIIFGVGAIIAVVAISQGASAFIQAQIDSLGTNIVLAMPSHSAASGARSGSGGPPTLTVADATAILKECPLVSAVTYIKRQNMQVVAGSQNWNTSIQGVSTDYLSIRNWPLAVGRSFTRQEEDSAARVCLLGQTAAGKLFAPGQDPLDAIIRIQNTPCQVIGLLTAKGQTGWGQDQDDTIIVPFATAERKIMGAPILGLVGMIMASAHDSQQTLQAEQDIAALLRARHQTPAGQEDDFYVRNMQDIADASAGAAQVMMILLTSVASIALLVGGIGIMNILLVSVTERTREIGVRMAVGAKTHHILFQFLIESMALSMVGGLLGIALGVGAAHLVARLAHWPSLLSPVAILGSFLFSGVVGILFGYYPAYKASRLDPIEALRYE